MSRTPNLLAAACHDLRQPLHAITLYLGALDKRVENPEAREILTKIERATQAMNAMLAGILELARLQSADASQDLSTFALQDLIDRIVADQTGGGVTAATTALSVRSDARLLERLLRILVANAVRHGGGAARIQVTVWGERAEIAVIDFGPGIAPADQARVFDEFVRLDGAKNADGLGLGLAIAKHIADLLQMPLELRSAPGEGATFIVRPPLSD